MNAFSTALLFGSCTPVCTASIFLGTESGEDIAFTTLLVRRGAVATVVRAAGVVLIGVAARVLAGCLTR